MLQTQTKFTYKIKQSYLLVDIYSSRKVSLYSWGISNSGCSTLILTTACWCSTLHVSSSLRRSWIILNLSVPRLPYLPGWLEKSNIYICFNGNTKKFKIYILLTNFFFFRCIFTHFSFQSQIIISVMVYLHCQTRTRIQSRVDISVPKMGILAIGDLSLERDLNLNLQCEHVLHSIL